MIINNYISWLQREFYVNFPHMLALKASRLNAGSKWIFNSENKALQNKLNEFWEKQLCIDKIRKMLYTMSYMGKGIMFLSVNKDNEIELNYVKNPIESRVATINEKEKLAEIWFRPYNGDDSQLIKVQITKEKYIITTYYQTQVRIGSTSANQETKTELKQISQQEYKNYFNDIPVWQFENFPVPNIWGASTFGVPDWWLSKDLIEQYQTLIRIKNVELRNNRTRLVIDSDNIKDNSTGLDDIAKDSIINSRIQQLTRGTSAIGTSAIQYLLGDPKLEIYNKDLEYMENTIFNYAGYTPFRSNGNDSYTNKNESLFKDKLDIETTLFKQSIIKDKFYLIFDMVLSFYGLQSHKEGIRDYSFDITSLNMIDKVTLLDEFEKATNLGILFKAEARSEYKNISLSQAKDDIEQINKEQEEDLKQISKYQNNNENINASKDILGGD